MQKMYFSISEAAKITSLAPHVLRYWETEFKQLHPKKNRAGNRTYRESDIKLIKEIKLLLHEERFTIDGARQRLAKRSSQESGQLNESTGPASTTAEKTPPLAHAPGKNDKLMKEIKNTLREILDLFG